MKTNYFLFVEIQDPCYNRNKIICIPFKFIVVGKLIQDDIDWFYCTSKSGNAKELNNLAMEMEQLPQNISF